MSEWLSAYAASPLRRDISPAREDLIRQMESHGFRMAREHTFLPYQYFLVFTPAG